MRCSALAMITCARSPSASVGTFRQVHETARDRAGLKAWEKHASILENSSLAWRMYRWAKSDTDPTKPGVCRGCAYLHSAPSVSVTAVYMDSNLSSVSESLERLGNSQRLPIKIIFILNEAARQINGTYPFHLASKEHFFTCTFPSSNSLFHLFNSPTPRSHVSLPRRLGRHYPPTLPNLFARLLCLPSKLTPPPPPPHLPLSHTHISLPLLTHTNAGFKALHSSLLR